MPTSIFEFTIEGAKDILDFLDKFENSTDEIIDILKKSPNVGDAFGGNTSSAIAGIEKMQKSIRNAKQEMGGIPDELEGAAEGFGDRFTSEVLKAVRLLSQEVTKVILESNSGNQSAIAQSVASIDQLASVMSSALNQLAGLESVSQDALNAQASLISGRVSEAQDVAEAIATNQEGFDALVRRAEEISSALGIATEDVYRLDRAVLENQENTDALIARYQRIQDAVDFDSDTISAFVQAGVTDQMSAIQKAVEDIGAATGESFGDAYATEMLSRTRQANGDALSLDFQSQLDEAAGLITPALENAFQRGFKGDFLMEELEDVTQQVNLIPQSLSQLETVTAHLRKELAGMTSDTAERAALQQQINDMGKVEQEQRASLREAEARRTEIVDQLVSAYGNITDAEGNFDMALAREAAARFDTLSESQMGIVDNYNQLREELTELTKLYDQMVDAAYSTGDSRMQKAMLASAKQLETQMNAVNAQLEDYTRTFTEAMRHATQEAKSARAGLSSAARGVGRAGNFAQSLSNNSLVEMPDIVGQFGDFAGVFGELAQEGEQFNQVIDGMPDKFMNARKFALQLANDTDNAFSKLPVVGKKAQGIAKSLTGAKGLLGPNMSRNVGMLSKAVGLAGAAFQGAVIGVQLYDKMMGTTSEKVAKAISKVKKETQELTNYVNAAFSAVEGNTDSLSQISELQRERELVVAEREQLIAEAAQYTTTVDKLKSVVVSTYTGNATMVGELADNVREADQRITDLDTQIATLAYLDDEIAELRDFKGAIEGVSSAATSFMSARQGMVDLEDQFEAETERMAEQADLQESIAKRRDELESMFEQEDWARQRIEAEMAYRESLQDIVDDYNQTLLNNTESANEQIANAYADMQEQIAEINTSQAEEILEAQENFAKGQEEANDDYYQQLADDEEDYRRQRIRALEDLYNQLADLEMENDVLGFMRAKKDADKQFKREDEDRARELADKQDQFEETRIMNELAHQQELADLKLANAERKFQLRESYNETLAQTKESLAEQNAAAFESMQTQRDAEISRYAEQEANAWDQLEREQLRADARQELEDQLAAEQAIRDEEARQERFDSEMAALQAQEEMALRQLEAAGISRSQMEEMWQQTRLTHIEDGNIRALEQANLQEELIANLQAQANADYLAAQAQFQADARASQSEFDDWLKQQIGSDKQERQVWWKGVLSVSKMALSWGWKINKALFWDIPASITEGAVNLLIDLSGRAIQAMRSMTDGVISAFDRMGSSILSLIRRTMAAITSIRPPSFSNPFNRNRGNTSRSSGSSSGSSTGEKRGIRDWLNDIRGRRAEGGPVREGEPVVVGEEGAEILYPGRGGGFVQSRPDQNVPAQFGNALRETAGTLSRGRQFSGSPNANAVIRGGMGAPERTPYTNPDTNNPELQTYTGHYKLGGDFEEPDDAKQREYEEKIKERDERIAELKLQIEETMAEAETMQSQQVANMEQFQAQQYSFNNEAIEAQRSAEEESFAVRLDELHSHSMMVAEDQAAFNKEQMEMMADQFTDQLSLAQQQKVKELDLEQQMALEQMGMLKDYASDERDLEQYLQDELMAFKDGMSDDEIAQLEDLFGIKLDNLREQGDEEIEQDSEIHDEAMEARGQAADERLEAEKQDEEELDSLRRDSREQRRIDEETVMDEEKTAQSEHNTSLMDMLRGFFETRTLSEQEQNEQMSLLRDEMFLAEMDQYRAQHEEYLALLTEFYELLRKTESEQYAERITLVTDNMLSINRAVVENWNAINSTFERGAGDMSRVAEKSITDLTRTVERGMKDFERAARSGDQSFNTLVRGVEQAVRGIESAARRAAAAASQAQASAAAARSSASGSRSGFGGSNGSRSSSSSSRSSGSSFLDRAKSFFGRRAEGGPVARGRGYLVGEEGEELFFPNQDGQIVPADGTRELLQGNPMADQYQRMSYNMQMPLPRVASAQPSRNVSVNLTINGLTFGENITRAEIDSKFYQMQDALVEEISGLVN